jgi:Coenzyme PQQ synthesis protein D (PqqD)
MIFVFLQNSFKYGYNFDGDLIFLEINLWLKNYLRRNKMNPLIPNAKLDNIVVQEFSDEILIYNLKTNKAYSLNETTTLVWKNCDGAKSISQIAMEVEKTINQKIPEDLVWLALENLKKENLISFEGDTNSAFKGFNRREAIKKVGLATMAALPLLVSISAPTAANAQSGVGACTDCVVDLGFDMMTGKPVGVCPELCSGLMCVCFGNNSCSGEGQQFFNKTCEECRSIDNGDKNNSWRCFSLIG